jgi:hypothetical protein
MLHKIFNNDDRASLVRMGIAIPSVLNIIGFVMMQFSEEIPSIGHNLTYASAMALYFVVGIVVWSLYLTPDLRTSKCIAFICVFTAAAFGIAVSSALPFSRDDTLLLLVSQNFVRRWLNLT